MMLPAGMKLFIPTYGSRVFCLSSTRSKSSHPLPHDRFRLSLGLTDRVNKTRELQDYPDYSFTDGRPTPVTPGQLQKIKRQQELAASAVKHLKEIRFIEERYKQKVQSAQSEREQIIKSKLKPKGDELIKSKSNLRNKNKE